MIEILAPVGRMDTLNSALFTGADAVYLGLNALSARANAANFTEDELIEAAKQCRLFGTKIYLAVNTLVFEDELAQVHRALDAAVSARVNAVIVQDLAVMKLAQRKGLAVHASTQMSIHSPAGAKWALEQGFARVVLARELSKEQIAAIIRDVKIETEVFVHGALCVSVSGQCLLSAFRGGRSANRGRCAQPCRLPFENESYPLSLKDLSLINRIRELQTIGVTSAKIEGRMKRPEYVASVVDACVQARAGHLPDMERLSAVFSRSGFTSGYFDGTLRDMKGVRGEETDTAVLRGTHELYRKPRKLRSIDFNLRITQEGIAAECLCGGVSVSAEYPPPQPASTRELTVDDVTKAMAKLGGSVFAAGNIRCEIEPGLYLPMSSLNHIRRDLTGRMERELREGTGG
jgi:putative protease